MTKIWSGGVTDAQFHKREWVLNMNMIEATKGETCIVRWLVSPIYSARTMEKVSANEKRYDIIAKTVKQVRQVGE